MDRAPLHLDSILERAEGSFRALDGKRVFITGGTGFVGKWLLEAFRAASERLGIRVSLTILTRSEAAFRSRCPDLCEIPGLTFAPGDVRTFPFPSADFQYFIHAAADAARPASCLDTLDVNVQGTRRVLELAGRNPGARLLLLSSGAVYGVRPSEAPLISTQYRGEPSLNTHNSAYAQGKRTAEWLTIAMAKEFGFSPAIARIFTVAGPQLPLDSRYAVGNFVRDALEGKDIQIAGNGTPIRSYMHGADLTVWLLAILTQSPGFSVWDVGSEEPVSIKELALRVSELSGSQSGIRIALEPRLGSVPENYVPNTARAKEELNLSLQFSLNNCIEDMIAWQKGL